MTIAKQENTNQSVRKKRYNPKSLSNYGKIIIVDSLSDAAKLSNEIAPEHLELCVKEPLIY